MDDAASANKVRRVKKLKKNHQSQAEKAADLIRLDITRLEWPPGNQLDEKEMMEKYKVGRTPVREALILLSGEGFVRALRQRRGFQVRELDFKEMGQLFEAYYSLERLVSHLCSVSCEKLVSDLRRIQEKHTSAIEDKRYIDISLINSDFHLRITDSIDNEYIEEYARRLHNHERRLNYFVYVHEAAFPEFQNRQFKKIIEEHHEIINAIQIGDRKSLIDTLSTHSNRIKVRLSYILGKNRAAKIQFD